MSLAFDYMVIADALSGSAVRLRSVLERDAPNVNARTEDAEWLERLAAVCRERAADITPPALILIDNPQPAEAAAKEGGEE